MIMNLRYALNIWRLNALLILTFFYGETNSWKLADLNRICLHYFPFEVEDNSYNTTTPPNNFCTGVATYWDYSIHPPRNAMDISAFKRDLPYVYIYDRFLYNEMKNAFHPDNINVFIDDLNFVILHRSIDVIVFDFLDDKSDELEEYDEAFQDHLTSLCQTLKDTHKDKDLLVGLKLHRNAEVVKSALNVEKVKKVFDFYIISSYDYNQCVYVDDRALMAAHPSPIEMQESINALKKVGYDVKKMILTVNIYVISFKESKAQPEYWSNTWMCQSEPGDDRRFCRGTLENIYQRSKLVFDNQLAGVLVEASDCDDYANNCGCTSWPAIQCVCDGVHGRPKNEYLMDCQNFGLFPDERP